MTSPGQPVPPAGPPPQYPLSAPPTGEQQPTPQPATSGTPYGFDDRGHVRHTKVSGVWAGLIAAGVVLILLLIFIAQNLHTVGLHFLGFYGKVSVGLALLVAAVCGLLIALVPGTIRILQLRKALRRNVPDAGGPPS